MRRYICFERAVLLFAWNKTWRLFLPEVGHIPTYISVFLTGSGVLWLVSGPDSAMEELRVALSYLLGAFLVFGTLLAWNLVRGPYELWSTDKKAIKELNAELAERGASKELARRMEDCFERGEKLWEDYESLNRIGWFQKHADWYDQAVAIVSEAGDDERSLFATVAPKPQLGDHVSPENERANLRGRLNKLRYIVSRCYERAEGREKTEAKGSYV